MILKIFPSDTTSYDTVHGYLPDAISCKVSEERSGAFDLEMEYPLSGVRYDELAEGAIRPPSANDMYAGLDRYSTTGLPGKAWMREAV